MEITPDFVLEFIKQWALVLVTIFSGIITASSVAVRFLASYIKNHKELDPEYDPGKLLITILALLQALAYNSITANELLAQAKAANKK